jgi:hypothetical protein
MQSICSSVLLNRGWQAGLQRDCTAAAAAAAAGVLQEAGGSWVTDELVEDERYLAAHVKGKPAALTQRQHQPPDLSYLAELSPDGWPRTIQLGKPKCREPKALTQRQHSRTKGELLAAVAPARQRHANGHARSSVPPELIQYSSAGPTLRQNTVLIMH